MMKAGRYYVGDLCYCMDDVWDEVCDLMFNSDDKEHELTLSDGRKFAYSSTKYGDGSYYDDEGREYWVDAGLIGCILVDDIRDDKSAWVCGGAHIIEFDKDFEVIYRDGTIHIGDITIETDDKELPDDYCEDCGQKDEWCECNNKGIY